MHSGEMTLEIVERGAGGDRQQVVEVIRSDPDLAAEVQVEGGDAVLVAGLFSEIIGLKLDAGTVVPQAVKECIVRITVEIKAGGIELQLAGNSSFGCRGAV